MKKIEYQAAHSDDPKSIVAATTTALINGMKESVTAIKKDLKAPGMTWEQIDYFLSRWEKNKPSVITEEEFFKDYRGKMYDHGNGD